MMATEATPAQSVDVSVNDAPTTQTTATASDPQDGEHHIATPLSSAGTGSLDEIENKQIADIVDELVNSAEVSVSGGSDTEASGSKGAKSLDDKGHVRTSSAVKKPHSFKSVSVNRTFLASKSGSNSASRAEASAASTPSITPIGTPGSSVSKLKLVAKSGSSLGGATKTLTTNGKPAAVPDPSSVWNRNRPVPTPEPKKMSDEELMSKYGIHMADRLKPEDDKGQANWADIDDDEEWAPETITWTDGTKITLPHVDEHMPLTPAKELGQHEKPRSPAPGLAGSAKASPSIKPGVLASGKGLILKGVPEKPTLVAKAPAPQTPAKNPWGQLPPIEKASLVFPEPMQHHPRGYPPRDGPGARGMTPPPMKEIAADDFSRSSWRDGSVGGSRELFNSHSGKYEPVQDRRSSRADQNRPPALLQRTQTHDMQGPAEPSAAFQTHRTSGDAPPYGRRRGSSIVSGGSGSFVSRLERPHDMPQPGELGRSISPVSSVGLHPSPRMQMSQPWQPRPSPGQNHAVPYQPQAVPEADPTEEALAQQKKLMRERREAAIRRRMEEEAKEEAARRERIRLKLEAMGPAPERKSAKKEEGKETSTVIHQRDSIPAALLPKSQEKGDKSASAAESTNDAARIEVPVPPSKDQVVPQQVDKSQNDSSRPAPIAAQPTSPWPDSHQAPDRLASWSSSSQSTSRNVWGAPGNDRSLGNGTFNAGLAADSQPAQPASLTARPGPIAPPRTVAQAQQPSARQPPIGTPSARQQATSQRPVARNPWATVDIVADDRRIALESKARLDEQMKDLASQGLSIEDAQAPIHDNWRSVHVSVEEDGARKFDKSAYKVHGASKGDTANASWDQRQEAMSPAAQQVRAPSGMRSDYGRQPPIRPSGPAAAGPISQTRSSSRFFPQTTSPQDARTEDTMMQSRSKSPTPPPPTMDGHPAYDGDAHRPHVALPPTRPVVKLPPPTVRLPQTAPKAPAPIGPSRPSSFAAAAAGRSVSNQGAGPLHPQAAYGRPSQMTMQENWQDRINNLIGRKPVSPAKPMTVNSSSKSALEYAYQHTPATVSLPSLSPSGSITSDDSCFTSREMAEECFGEQEMGSLPPVRLPSEAPLALWQAVEPNWHPAPAKFRIDPFAADITRFPYDIINNKTMIRICVPGMDEAKAVPAPFSPRNRSNPRRQGPRGGRHVSRGGTRGPRDENSASNADRSERPSSHRSRGGFRGRSDNWSRPTSSAQATQS